MFRVPGVISVLVAAVSLQACVSVQGPLHGEYMDARLYWDKYGGVLTGTARYDGFQQRYRVFISVPGETDAGCDGFIEMRKKTWAIACPDGAVVEGPVSAGGGSRVNATGTGPEGKRVRLEIRDAD